ncbi:MAG: hypothetical protein Q8O30_11550 [Candidatus Omnitrophota bacterium]|nr:hypothetical protein [Candidatus Omnitrophota bacterium]
MEGLIIFLLFGVFSSFADTIILKNGRTVEGLIIEKAESYIKVNFEGVELKFYNDEIKEIIPNKEEPALDAGKYAELSKITLIEKVLELSGIKRQMEQIYTHVIEGYAQHRDSIAPKFYELGSKIIRETYSIGRIYKDVRDYFDNYFERERITAVEEFLESPLSKKITELEVQVSSPEALEEIKKFGNELPSNPPSLERIELIKKLDKNAGSTQLQLEITVNTYQNIVKAIDPLLPAQKRLKVGELEKIEETMRTKLEPVLENAVSVYFLYAYRSLTDEELKQYLDFWLSDNGKWFNKTTAKAFRAAMNKAGKDIAIAFIEAYRDIKIEPER